MTSLRKRWAAWRADPALGMVLRNTGYLFSSNTISMVLTSVQGILAAVLLGPANYGALGIIVMFCSSVNRLLSFRMNELVVKYAGQDLATGEKERAAAVIKVAGMTEAATSLVAFGLLALIAPLAARYFVHDESTTPWIILYGLTLAANLVTETSTAVLQIGNHYGSQALLNLVQSILTFGWIVAAFFLHGDMYWVLMGYLIGKAFFGFGIAFLALRWLNTMFGKEWRKARLATIQNRRELARFAISTNLSGTINMVIRDSEVLWVGLFTSTIQAGYYKFALAIMNVAYMPVTSLVTTTFPQISASVAKFEWSSLTRLLRRTSLLVAGWTAATFIGLALLGPWLLTWLKEGAYLPSLPGMLILSLGMGIPNIFYWNRPLLLSFGKPNYPLVVNAITGAIKTVLMFFLVRPFGYLMQAGLLSLYFLVSVGLNARKGLLELKRVSHEKARLRPV